MPNYCIFFSLPKTPVGSFNKSNAHTPLVSPLTMIREEDLEVGNLVFDLMGVLTDLKYSLLNITFHTINLHDNAHQPKGYPMPISIQYSLNDLSAGQRRRGGRDHRNEAHQGPVRPQTRASCPLSQDYRLLDGKCTIDDEETSDDVCRVGREMCRFPFPPAQRSI